MTLALVVAAAQHPARRVVPRLVQLPSGSSTSGGCSSGCSSGGCSSGCSRRDSRGGGGGGGGGGLRRRRRAVTARGAGGAAAHDAAATAGNRAGAEGAAAAATAACGGAAAAAAAVGLAHAALLRDDVLGHHDVLEGAGCGAAGWGGVEWNITAITLGTVTQVALPSVKSRLPGDFLSSRRKPKA